MYDFMDHFLSSVKTVFELRDFKIAGKLDMQKSFYFAKELGLPIYFKFRWGKLGPFSNELSYALSVITNKGFISYNGNYEYEEKNFRHVKYLELNKNVNKFFNELNDYAEKNSVDEIFFIETLASMHFLHKYSNIPSKEGVISKLGELKTDRVSMLSPYYDSSWKLLQKHGMVYS